MNESAELETSRYIRQIKYAPFGSQGQQNLANSCVLIVGLGALGSVIANTLARAGVGKLRIVDRDYLERNNLQRQVLYTEADVDNYLPKAIAAKNHLQQINSEIEIEAIVTHVDHQSLLGLLDQVDLILDGTDNFEIRFLLNDASLKYKIPWIYGGCIGAEGQTMTILPGKTACLRCLMSESPPPGSTPTCDTAGILSPIINVIASLQSMEAIKILSGNQDQVETRLRVFDLWGNRIRELSLENLKNQNNCPACSKGQFDWLGGNQVSQTAILCGRNSVQLNFPNSEPLDLEKTAERLKQTAKVQLSRFMLRFHIDEYQISLFPDGRAIISGTQEEAVARSLYDKYIGS